ncbi:MAG: BrnA antitoxin family protein [Elusimicrobiota bacterium]
MKRKTIEVDPENPPLTESDFKRARRVTAEEHGEFLKAVQNFRARGRPKKIHDKYRPVTIRLHPHVLEWARTEAKRRGMGYQTVINQTLLARAG